MAELQIEIKSDPTIGPDVAISVVSEKVESAQIWRLCLTALSIRRSDWMLTVPLCFPAALYGGCSRKRSSVRGNVRQPLVRSTL